MEVVDIAVALAGAADTQFTVKGVVTLVDGQNLYLQDATGGIRLSFASVPENDVWWLNEHTLSHPAPISTQSFSVKCSPLTSLLTADAMDAG